MKKLIILAVVLIAAAATLGTGLYIHNRDKGCGLEPQSACQLVQYIK